MTSLDHHAGLLPFATDESPGFTVGRVTRAHWSVRLWGSLGPFWADSFSQGLARARVSILRGFARQHSNGRWIADFLLLPGLGAPEPSSIDFLGLAAGAPVSE